ncbi:site-specific integrase, partial [Patescibacteria group bacterium]|nr:site-specific integrase [Patescibacteria group bacterium]
MNLLSQFKNYLFSQKNPPSKLTVKNYAADVNQFIRWFETELGKEFNPQEISPETIEAYKKAKSVSTRSLERHLSSLRKFFQFLRTEGIISSDPLQQQSNVKQ